MHLLQSMDAPLRRMDYRLEKLNENLESKYLGVSVDHMVTGLQQGDAMKSSDGCLPSRTNNIITRPQRTCFQELDSGFFLTQSSNSGKMKAHRLSYGCTVLQGLGRANLCEYSRY
jgi:hypothetical protein